MKRLLIGVVLIMFAALVAASQTTVVCSRNDQGQLYNCYEAAPANQPAPVVYPTAEVVEYSEPAYNQQRQRTVVQNINGGFNGYRPWVSYGATIVHSTVTVTSNMGQTPYVNVYPGYGNYNNGGYYPYNQGYYNYPTYSQPYGYPYYNQQYGHHYRRDCYPRYYRRY